MAQHKSAIKRIRQTEKRRRLNRMKRSRMKTAIKKVRLADSPETAQQALRQSISIIDKMAVQGVIHPNKAANLKSKLMRLVQRSTLKKTA